MSNRIICALGLLLFPILSHAAWESEVLLHVTTDDPAKITAALLWSPNVREFLHSKELPLTSKVVVQSVNLRRIAYRYKNDETCSVVNPATYVIYTTEGSTDFYILSDPAHTQSRLIVNTTPLNPCKRGEKLFDTNYQEEPTTGSNK